VLASVHTVSIEIIVPPIGGVIGFGTNFQVTCSGIPVRVRFIGELKLPIEVTVTVKLPQLAWLITSKDGPTVRVKSEGAKTTFRPTVMLCVISSGEELPVIVRL
jgi:hypothetical protein